VTNVFNEALASIGAAIQDVREKLVEQAFFGQVATHGGAPSPAPEDNTAPEEPTFGGARHITFGPCQPGEAFEGVLETVIAAPPDPDIQPHGQVIDR
jgi:hypothetical protein